jgi:hypothetical protein
LPLHRPEQQSPLAVHALPSVLHLVLSAAHLPVVHVPLQHWLLPVHAVPSEMQAGKPQAPWLQVPLQQTPFEAHPLPSEMHPPSLPNGPPESPMPTEPLLLPLPPLLLSAPLLLPEPPLLLDVASPPSTTPFAPAPLLLPHAMNEAPEPRPATTATHTTSAVRRRTMRGAVHASFQGGQVSMDADLAPEPSIECASSRHQLVSAPTTSRTTDRCTRHARAHRLRARQRRAVAFVESAKLTRSPARG